MQREPWIKAINQNEKNRPFQDQMKSHTHTLSHKPLLYFELTFTIRQVEFQPHKLSFKCTIIYYLIEFGLKCIEKQFGCYKDYCKKRLYLCNFFNLVWHELFYLFNFLKSGF